MPGCWVDNAIRYRGVRSELTTSMNTPSYLLVSGCSHTEGVGIDAKYSWASVASRQLNLDLINLARRGACAQYVSDVTRQWLDRSSIIPRLIIMQWPNPYRDMRVANGQIKFVNVSHKDPEFEQRMRQDPDSFLAQWRQIIQDFNHDLPCPVINICLESLDSDLAVPVQQLSAQGINIHLDEKRSGHTWHFDSAASDRLHHSEQCHQKWADRILTLAEYVV
jgi:hypothetical protein